MRRAGVQSMPRGLSLLELLVVLTISAILLSIAIPVYRGHAQRAQRADAIRALLEISACQERVRASTGFYDTTRCLPDAGPETYLFELLPENDTTTLVFTALAAPKNRADGCGTLRLDHSGTRSVSADAGRVSDCWGGR